MKAIAKGLGIGVLLLGLVGLALGIVFIVNGVSTRAMVADELRTEQITLGLPTPDDEGYVEGALVDTAGEAEVASTTVKEHRRNDYGTYGETARGSTERATFLDALTLENSLNLAQAGFGVSTMAIGSGVFMVVMGTALIGTGITLHRFNGHVS